MKEMKIIVFDRLELWTLLERLFGTREAIELYTLMCEIEEKEK